MVVVPYLPAIVVLALGLVLLGLLLVQPARGLRRFRRTTNIVVADVRDNVGLLRARVAGLRVALAQRRQ